MAVISDDSAASAWPPGLAESATSCPHTAPVPPLPTMPGRIGYGHDPYGGAPPPWGTWARRKSRNVVVAVALRFGPVAEALDRAVTSFETLKPLSVAYTSPRRAPRVPGDT